jgi:Zn-dependent protease with chaperone function/tetratricopeptide (TPR) repeat protein
MNKQSINIILSRVLLSVFLCLSFSGISLSQGAERDAAKEEPHWQELGQKAPAAVPKFKEATLSLDTQKYEDAIRLYTEVLKLSPDFEPAIRRLGYAYVAVGRRKEGQELTAKTLSKNRSVENLVGRASSLLSSNDPNFRPSHAETSEALLLSKEAWQKSGETDEQAAGIMAETLLSTNQITEFEQFSRTLPSKFPESPMPPYYQAIALANRGDFDAAEAEIKRSEALGLSPEAATSLLAAINTARDEAYFGLGRYLSYLYFAAFLVGVWFVGLAGLFFTGRVLSAKTLKSIEESDPNDISGGGQAKLRNFYKKIISIAGVYYYISQPFVIFLVIAATAGIILIFLWIGTIPVKLVLVLAFVGLATIFYMIKSLVMRAKIEDPGRALTEAEAPALWKLVREVASTMQTRPVDEIRITPGADLAVYERGGFRAKMSDTAERILILGAAVLNDFDQNAFRSVLAHEYGHFSNRDTAGGDIAFRVNMDIMRAAESMAQSGTATFYNLGFQFLRLFHFLFRRITHGATRLQEILADRVAAYNYGAAAFRDGLSHVIRRELEFNHLATKEINAASLANRSIGNLYEMSVQEESAVTDLNEQFQAVVSMATTEDDTHPSPTDRFKYLEGIKSKEAPPLVGTVWDLFADRNAITVEMNEMVERLAFANVA